MRVGVERAAGVVGELGGAEAREDGVGLEPVAQAGVLVGRGRLGRWRGVEGGEVGEDFGEDWGVGGADEEVERAEDAGGSALGGVCVIFGGFSRAVAAAGCGRGCIGGLGEPFGLELEGEVVGISCGGDGEQGQIRRVREGDLLWRMSSTSMPYSAMATLLPLKSALRVASSFSRTSFSRETIASPPSLTS